MKFPRITATVAEPGPNGRAVLERAQFIADVMATIQRRRDRAYGSLQITDDQVDELARAIVTLVTLRDGGDR